MGAFYVIEWMFRRKELDKKFYTYKYHILLLVKEILGGESPNVNKKKEIEKYCNELISKIGNYENLRSVSLEACKQFDQILNEWIDAKGEKSQYHVKDNPNFTLFLLDMIRNGVESRDDKENYSVCIGRILNFQTDKNGDYYGFIQREPDNIFFHEKSSPNIELSFVGKEVQYRIGFQSDKMIATNVLLLDTN